MSKEKILEEFWSKLRKNLMWRDSESGFVEKHITELINEVIVQTREETIRETLKEIRDYIRDNEKLGYENRVLVGDEIYAKLSIMYDKSLINK